MSKFPTLLDDRLEVYALSQFSGTGIKPVPSIHTSGEEQGFLTDEVFQSCRRPIIITTPRDAALNEEAQVLALKEGGIRGAGFTLPQADLKSGEYPDSVKPFLDLGNVVIAPEPGRTRRRSPKKNVKSLAAAVSDYLVTGDMSLAVNPPELFGGPVDRHYPLSICTRRTALPLAL